MHYKVRENCRLGHAEFFKDQIILEGDMPRDALLPLITEGKVEQFGEIDPTPYVAPPPPVVPKPTPLIEEEPTSMFENR